MDEPPLLRVRLESSLTGAGGGYEKEGAAAAPNERRTAGAHEAHEGNLAGAGGERPDLNPLATWLDSWQNESLLDWGRDIMTERGGIPELVACQRLPTP